MKYKKLSNSYLPNVKVEKLNNNDNNKNEIKSKKKN